MDAGQGGYEVTDATLATYIERLRDNPDFQAYEDEIVKDIAQKLDALISQPAGTSAEKIEALRGEIKGLMARIVKPQRVHMQLITRRREQVQNG